MTRERKRTKNRCRVCSRLGDGRLSEPLKRLEAHLTLPSYRKLLLAERAPVIQEMTTAGCICGDAMKAHDEIARWLKGHPDDPARRALEDRKKALGTNPAIRFRCSSAAP